jgi:hypothetical protein
VRGYRLRGSQLARWRPSPTQVAIIAASLLALGVRLWQFARPGSLTGIVEYDDGPYVGSTILLTHGIMPYRDYIFVQPPGIMVILAPVAFLARAGWLTTAGVMATGRVLTALASTAGVPVLGLLLRHRGVAAVTVGCGLLAVYTGSIQAAHTVLLEPWLALLCLLGAITVFDGDRLAGNRRLGWGGVIFGLAGAVEAWAILPVMIVAALCLPGIRRVARFLAGVGGGFLAVALPFASQSPSGFYQGVITAQIGRRAHAIRVSDLYRFKEMAGLDLLYRWSAWATVVVALGVVVLIAGCVLTGWLLTGRGPVALDWYMLAATAGTIVMFMSPSQFLYHFMGFLGPFLAASIALPLARCMDGVRHWLPISRMNWPQGLLTALVIPVVGVFALLQVLAMAGRPGYLELSSGIQRLVPPGACVLSDTGPPLVIADRLISSEPGCVTLLDSMGADLELSHGLKPDTGAWRSQALEQMWRNAFAHAQYVLLKFSPNPRVPWTPSLRAYFQQHFTAIFHQGTLQGSGAQYYTLYRRNQPAEGRPRRSASALTPGSGQGLGTAAGVRFGHAGLPLPDQPGAVAELGWQRRISAPPPIAADDRTPASTAATAASNSDVSVWRLPRRSRGAGTRARHWHHATMPRPAVQAGQGVGDALSRAGGRDKASVQCGAAGLRRALLVQSHDHGPGPGGNRASSTRASPRRRAC